MSRAWSIVFVLAILGPLSAAWADPQGDELRAKVVEAYQKIETYEGTTQFKVDQRKGRWWSKEGTDYHVVFDRKAGKFTLDKADMLIVDDGNKLMLKSDQVWGYHLAVDAPKPLDYETLSEAVPFVKKRVLPDVVMLLAADPIAVLNGGKPTEVKAVDPDPEDTQKRPGLRLVTSEGRITLRLDPATFLVAEMTVELRVPPDLNDPTGETRSASITYQMKVEKHNVALAADAFAFPTANSTAVASLDELRRAGQRPGKHPLEGRDAPPVELSTIEGKAFKLSEDEARVVVLDFWATWCGPCREGLPVLQKVADWARDEKKSVAVYAVNLRETPEQAKKFWDEAKLTLPILMDPEGVSAEAYQVNVIPQTVVISGGKVVHVATGLDPDGEHKLRTLIEGLLKDEPK